MSEKKDRKTVFLGMPGYGTITADASRGFWRASNGGLAVNYLYMQGSLLAQGFNGIWCAALNAQMAGKQIDYFAMQHSDVEPCDFWLDLLVDELERKDLDILGVAVPIKDGKGITSIALNDPTDNWRVKCRLSLEEIYRLPVTFTSEDVGHQILLNTGLWVCKFDPKWNTEVHFEINDRIVFDTSSNSYVAQVEPEDWFFSRLLHELNLKIGCTRMIPLNHRGAQVYTNAKVYGDKFDKLYLNESLVPERSQEWKFPSDVEGWLSEPEGRKLAELSEGKDVLEIGSFKGRSTICIAQTAKSVVSIDTHDARGTAHYPMNTLPEFRANLARYGIRNIRSSDGSDLEPVEQFDLVFIDGSHDYDSVSNDIERSLPLLREDGVLAFHDFARSTDPDVSRRVNEFLSAGAELLTVTDTLAVVKPPASILMET